MDTNEMQPGELRYLEPGEVLSPFGSELDTPEPDCVFQVGSGFALVYFEDGSKPAVAGVDLGREGIRVLRTDRGFQGADSFIPASLPPEVQAVLLRAALGVKE